MENNKIPKATAVSAAIRLDIAMERNAEVRIDLRERFKDFNLKYFFQVKTDLNNNNEENCKCNL